MKVSVIIPTLNEGERIRTLLRSLKKAPYPDKEIIVVDGGSRDNTVKIAKEEGVRVLQEEGPIKGPGNAKNQGVKVSRGKIIGFIDADNKKVNRKFFREVMKHFEDKDVVGVLTASNLLPSTFFRKWYLTLRSSTFSQLADSKLYGYTPSFTFIRKELFLHLGKFSPRGTGEDDILLLKLKKYLLSHPSKKIIYEPNAIIYDGSALTFQEYLKQSIWYGKSALFYFRSSKRKFFSKLIIAFGPLGYATCLTSFLLLPLSTWFLIPSLFYIPKLGLIFWDTFKDRKYHRLLTPLIDLIKGYGHMYGLIYSLVSELKNVERK